MSQESQDYNKINDEFLTELFKACITSKSVLEIVIKHLKFHYIIGESYKKIFEKISQVYQLEGVIPTIGLLSQYFNNDENTLKLLIKIKNTSLSENKDLLLKTFEKFLINVKFIDLYQKIGRLHNDGKQDKAIELLESESKEIANFTIKDSYYTTIFKSFEQRQLERRLLNKDNIGANKIPFSIHCLDEDTRGGMDKGTSTLVMARSGGGKSTFLRWVGMSAARMGFRVVHFQAEGTEKEALDAYDAGWTSVDMESIEFGFLPPEKVKLIEKANRDIVAQGGEVYIKASENFDELSVNDCNDMLEDMEKIHGKFDLAIFDYMDVFTVRGKYYNSESGERKRREDIANKITNIATSRNIAVLTATQSNDVRPDLYNNPDFVLTRSNISEYKGAIKPFSNFLTLNYTDDEYENNILRIYADKYRKYRSKKTHKICTSFSNSRFYDSKRTMSIFIDKK